MENIRCTRLSYIVSAAGKLDLIVDYGQIACIFSRNIHEEKRLTVNSFSRLTAALSKADELQTYTRR